ncbi:MULTISPECIES: hypothetical protein [Leptospira]|uniref:Uncharacterized protein n=3 Tax=Leptospira borgpetersenii TaxID=174 RepID=M3HHS6_LEPBO|nr:hypothetical protein [Leptospira borgpetersenii]AXX17396.1 hypothetical protein C4Q31_17625 [Leptospira borgpetersenii serovar Ceylonica]EMF97660.1 hypothetical protein LEP1GSC123_1273 [Leptospira borgpetersenii str. 200701203]EMK13646.1 hypothetical protein LEP1GSC066_1870 [Leptospira sp. serovar Kenya str. Sh9]EKP11828.1 hypothetical protein LEP1GSC128_1054 [Leptospira borgpetersenii str. 200801926]EKQ91540.1 hypothetical protein LEP1GSC101_1117 [Leptospira borgpetersenii str. UI 09149]
MEFVKQKMSGESNLLKAYEIRLEGESKIKQDVVKKYTNQSREKIPYFELVAKPKKKINYNHLSS